MVLPHELVSAPTFSQKWDVEKHKYTGLSPALSAARASLTSPRRSDTYGVADYEVNLELTKARAAAVAKALAALGIAPGRLRAEGAGMMAPVTSNDSEQGRARNRRVELVKR